MLYSKKPNLAGLREWGTKVWVHDASGTKLDGRSRIGRWIGFEEASNAHQILWLDNCSVTVEQNIKFDNNDLLILHALPAKGEKEDNYMSTQDSSTTSTNPIKHNTPQQGPDKLIPENQNPQQNDKLQMTICAMLLMQWSLRWPNTMSKSKPELLHLPL